MSLLRDLSNLLIERHDLSFRGLADTAQDRLVRRLSFSTRGPFGPGRSGPGLALQASLRSYLSADALTKGYVPHGVRGADNQSAWARYGRRAGIGVLVRFARR